MQVEAIREFPLLDDEVLVLQGLDSVMEDNFGIEMTVKSLGFYQSVLVHFVFLCLAFHPADAERACAEPRPVEVIDVHFERCIKARTAHHIESAGNLPEPGTREGLRVA